MLSKAQIKRQIKKISAVYYRHALTNRDFTIISNNCWGGVVYDRYNLPYLTPTIGLWIPPDDFIKFISDLPRYIAADLERISAEESKICDLLTERALKKGLSPQDIIIGRIEDVEIIFQHYKTFDEAYEKWSRRKKRINWDNILVKMNDQNGCTVQNFEAFMKSDYQNKIFITANEDYRGRENTIFVEKYRQYGYVVNDVYKNDDVPLDVTKYLNNMKRKI